MHSTKKEREREKKKEEKKDKQLSLTPKIPEYFIDVQDDALLHIAATIHPSVRSERIFAFAYPVNGDGVLSIFRKLYPTRTFPADFQAEKDISDIVPRQRAETLLRAMGREGWTSLEESLKRNTEDLV